MPAGSSLFLGLELAVDQLRASLVDENLELVGVECVDFDTELSEYQTQGGIFTTPGEAYTTPVEMWIKALDTLFEKLRRNVDLTRIKTIGGCAQHALVWWKSTAVPSLSSLDPHTPLVAHFSSAHFSLPNTPVAQDTSSHTHALTIEALVGGADHLVAHVGSAANPSAIAAQLLRVHETWPQDVWARTGRVQLASAFLASLVSGKWMPMAEAEACATGLWSHTANAWDEKVLDIVGGSREEGRRVRGWLGEVDLTGGGRRAGNISRYLVERYGFDPETGVTSFTSDGLAAYLSMVPSSNDVVIQFGPMDVLMAPAQHYLPTRLYNLFPHPAQDSTEKRRYIAVVTNRNADVPRALVRDMYTKSWSAFDRLVAIVPPGGSIGLDDKLFAFWYLQGDAHPFAHVKGIYRFETGIKVTEFRDLRANPRCLLESQILALRVKFAKILATGVLARGPPPPLSVHAARRSTAGALGVTFDPYDTVPLPGRILATGAAANFPSVANLVCDVFNAPVFVPTTQIASAQAAPHRNAPAFGCPSRGSLGAAYVARWVWGRDWVGSSGVGFEEEVRRVLGKRWTATGGAPLRASVARRLPRPPHVRAPNALLEEEEDEENAREMAERMGISLAEYRSPGVIGMTPSSSSSSGISMASVSTAFTTPDLGASGTSGMLSPGIIGANGTAGAGTPTTPTPLTPVAALPTSEAELQLGLAKVAEPDSDAFLAYAAIVPEYCRLEGMLVKGIV
ncbi:D-xylulose kinase [Mycena amicta]|nr:D-xylulose kinase [Mycena amicta]